MNRITRVSALACAAALFSIPVSAATVREETVEMKTYPFFDPDPVPATDKTRYPYFFIDGTTRVPEMRKWKAVILENEHVVVTILPEIGGKVWGARDKRTGRDFIYHNHVVKFRNIAQRGPWCSGGIEFNFGIIGHGPWTAAPVSYYVRSNPDGSVSCFVSDMELVTRTTWQVEIRLPDGMEGFLTKTVWFNGSRLREPYYQWMNAAFPLRGKPRFEFPGTAYIGHDGSAHAWPIDPSGHDLSDYEQTAFGRHKSQHVLCGDNGFYGIWWDEWGLGAVHRSRIDSKYGRKVWLWTQSREGAIWEDLLTDDDGQYTELQSGRAFNQPARGSVKTPFKELGFAPGTTDSFDEEWSVVRDRSSFEAAKDPAGFVSRPLKTPDDFDWDSPYGLYLTAETRHNQAFYAEAGSLLDKALAKDPHLLPALAMKASLAVRGGEFAKAHEFALRALAINTYDPEANYADGLAYLAEGNLRAARERLGMASYSPLFRAAAFTAIAKIALRNHDFKDAVESAEKALAADSMNQDALLVRIVAARRSGDAVRAKALLDSALSSLPLFFGARFEENLVDPSSRPMRELVRSEMPHETFISLGTWYEDCGLFDEAERLFAEASSTSIVAAVRRAYAAKLAGRSPDAGLAEAAKMPIAFAMPFRLESIPAFEWAVSASPCWKFKYLLGVLYAAKGRDAEADRQLAACAEEPDDPVFYLYRASRESGDCALADLRRAERLGGGWRANYEIAKHYLERKRPSEAVKAAGALTGKKSSNKLRIVYATALVADGRPKEAIKFMEKTSFLPSELGDNAFPAWVDAHRILAEKALERGDIPAVKEAVARAVSHPENLGLGRPYELSFSKYLYTTVRNPFADWSEELRTFAVEAMKALDEAKKGAQKGDPRRPYEFNLAGRVADEFPPADPLVGAAGWKVSGKECDVGIADARDRALFGDGVMRLRFRATGDAPSAVLSPEKPIGCPDGFDTISVWVYGDKVNAKDELFATFRRSDGSPFEMRLGAICHGEWHCMIGVVEPAERAGMAKGAQFSGFRLSFMTNRVERSLDFTSLCLFRDPQRPIPKTQRAKRGVIVFPDQDQGHNTGEGRLPFPDRPETMTPPVRDVYGLEFRLPDDDSVDWGKLAFRIDGGEWIPLANGSGLFPRKAAKGAKVKFRRVANSVVAEVRAPAGVEEVLFGSMAAPEGTSFVTWPYYTLRWCDKYDVPGYEKGGEYRPATALFSSGGRTFAVGAMFDWTQSSASAPTDREDAPGQLCCGVMYVPKTDGSRNPVFERYVWTVAERFSDLFPVIPNPDSTWKEVTGSGVWRPHAASDDRRLDYEYWTAVKAAGMDHLVVTDHERMWRDGNESFTFRAMTAPRKGGDAAAADYACYMTDDLGFRYGPYNNFTDFAPVNANWSIDRVARQWNGSLVTAWNRCYSPRSTWAVGMCEKLSPLIASKFAFNTAYCDVHTCVTPWIRCDYDVRAPGAGTFAQVFYDYGEIMLMQKKAWNGPVYSEGGFQWWYCGLADGNYAQDATYKLYSSPWLVDFDFGRIHDKCCNFGMGSVHMFYSGAKAGMAGMPVDEDEQLNRFLAATIAFGHPGFLAGGRDPSNLDKEKKSYFLVQGIAAVYTLQSAKSISYGDGEGRLLSTEQAVASGAYRRSQVKVVYADGTEVAVNGSMTEPFKVEVLGKKYEIPPNGWVAISADGSAGSTSLVEGGVLRQVGWSPEYRYERAGGKVSLVTGARK